ncbi:hypothetical protein BpHYR1_020898 [Brachionus plicatilis]|uniref:Uncharacterized protein n=1 Tax=Brachionus plicatilis TaxID=10195 RepID=A0A3M7RWC7_BRAPC|nr:hypothetical protein BpHYR1_020898 [Brachionus plicatilis]
MVSGALAREFLIKLANSGSTMRSCFLVSWWSRLRYLQKTIIYRKPLPSILGINLKFNRNSIWNSSHRNHVKN